MFVEKPRTVAQGLLDKERFAKLFHLYHFLNTDYILTYFFLSFNIYYMLGDL